MTKLPYEPHAFADLFPLHEGPPLWALADDIVENGLQEKIMLYQGKILDGRRRQLACVRAQASPVYSQFKGTDGEALAFVVSKNLHRRHLGDGERALIATKIATLKAGANQHTAEVTAIAVTSQAQAAELMNVSVDSIQRAKKVVEHGTPALQAAVANGTVSVSDAAAVASEPAKVQNQAVKQVEAGKAKTASQAAEKLREPGEDTEDGEPLLDDVGVPVPNLAARAFEVAGEIGSVCREIDGLTKRVGEGKGKEGWECVLLDSVTQALKNARQVLWQSRATHVCPYCKGNGKACNCCKGRGWTTKATYSSAPEELKAS